MSNLPKHLVFLFLLRAASVISQPYCSTSYCGKFEIKYPLWLKSYWLSNFTDYYCGFPGLGLDCENNIWILHTGNISYQVESSMDANNTYTFRDMDLLSRYCPRARYNVTLLSLPGIPLRLVGNYSIFFYFNCTVKAVRPPPEYASLPSCIGNEAGKESFAVFRRRNSTSGKDASLECEDIVESPVKDSVAGWNLSNGFVGALKEGFEVVVNADVVSSCENCTRTSHTCTYVGSSNSEEEYQFSCRTASFVSSEKNSAGIIIIAIACGAFVSWNLIVFGCCWACRKMHKRDTVGDSSALLRTFNNTVDEIQDLAHFDLATVALATRQFSPQNKIGAGGFGEVYKGILEDGQVIAVKRISLQSEDRINEFITEVKLIAKLQHRNLVRLLACCIEGGERLLIYEFVPNKSLDFFIFGDEAKRRLLDWEKRLSIIIGVARGLLYLHQDSRLRVIHRDLKAANVLLEEDMNPKISDFGTARIFEREKIQENTIKIVGTIGYMSPEYIMSGTFSEKSDVFSFGVLLLEVISGRRNKWISEMEFCMELLAKAWTLCMENEICKLLDSALNHPSQLDKISRFVRVGLLCVQESPEDRPTMQEVVLMLVKQDTSLSQPRRPGFFQSTSLPSTSYLFSLTSDSSRTKPELTITDVEAR